MSELPQISNGRRCIRFVERVTGDDTVWMAFADPAVGFAIAMESAVAGDDDFLEVAMPVSGAVQGAAEGAADLQRTGGVAGGATVFIKYRGVELMWQPRHALLQCEPEQASALFLAVVEFSHYERELRRIEREIAGSWAELDEDRRLAFEAKPADLKRSDIVGGRMARVLERRMRHARIEPHLYRPDTTLSAAGQKLGEELRDKAGVEARLETVDGQLEVFEHVYEMSSQRLGEYRAARQGHIMEWVIIVLLAVETFLLLGQTVWGHRI